MATNDSIESSLRAENAELRARLEETEELLRAIRTGAVDALVVEGDAGSQLFTLQGLDAEQSRFRGEMLAQVGDAVIAVDTEQRITFLNTAAELQYGVRACDVLGQALSEVHEGRWLRPEDEAEAMTALRERGEWHGENRHLRRDGRELHVESSVALLRDPDGAPAGMIAAIRDISARKQTEAALRLANSRVDLALKCSQVVLFQQDLELRYIWLQNPAPDFDGPDVVGKRDADLMERAEEAAIVEALKREVIRSSVSQRADVLVHIQGVGRHYDLLVEPMRDAAGLISGVTCAAIDITERKRAEDAVARLAAIVESSEDALFSEDLDGIVVSWNRGAEEVFGYTADEIIGSSIMRLIPEAYQADEHEHQRTLATGGRGGYLESWRRTKDGREFSAAITISPLKNAASTVIGTSRVVRDITERKRAEAVLAGNAAILADLDRRKDEFLATLAHELRNPLAPVRNAVAFLRAKGPAVPELQWASDVIDRQTQVLARLIDDLMDVSRINQGRLELNREHADLEKLVMAAVETSRPLIDKMGHTLAVTLPSRPVVVDADLVRLPQVFLNLLNNAAKYTERGGQIDLRAELQGSDVVVSVTDTGVGIPADKRSAIFEMFSQVEGTLSRSQGGLGIGLHLVKRLVELHDGRIEVRSDGPGQGSEFMVRLPIVVEQTYPSQASGDDGVKATATADLRILVVDDNRDSAESSAMLLKMMGNQVHMAHDGEAAVAAAQEFRPQVVLCDIGLPKLNGYEVCRQIRAQAWAEKVILIAVTGWGQDGDRRQAAEAGFDHHLVKPVDPEALMTLLAGLDTVKG